MVSWHNVERREGGGFLTPDWTSVIVEAVDELLARLLLDSGTTRKRERNARRRPEGEIVSASFLLLNDRCAVVREEEIRTTDTPW